MESITHVNIKKVSHYGKPAVRLAFTYNKTHKKIYVGKEEKVDKIIAEEFHDAKGELKTNLLVTGDFACRNGKFEVKKNG